MGAMDKNIEKFDTEKNYSSFENQLNNNILFLKNSKGISIDSEFDENFAFSEEEIILKEIFLGD
jgi:hypothetical protein